MRLARTIRVATLHRRVTTAKLRNTLLALEPLENRRLLAFTVNHTPYIQLGDAPLEGYNGGLDQSEILWQTTGTQGTDAFTAQVRETGTVPWSNVALNAQIVTGVSGRIVHSVTFAGLNFDDDYDYQITHLRDGSPIATYASTFHTRLNSSDSSNFSFVTYGDSASGDPPTNFIAVQNQINQIDPAFSLLLGDNVYNTGTHAEYDLRLDPSKNVPLTTYNKSHIDYFAFGNHDVGYLSGQAARENYSMPIPVQDVTSPAGLAFDANVQEEENYSFDYGGVHFVTFDTNNWPALSTSTSAAAFNKQLDWAVADINAAKARTNPPDWVVFFGHHPIASLAGHTEHTPDDYYYDQMVSKLGASGVGVDLLLFGHTHNYQRSYPLTGHVGATATYVLDTDSNYAKGDGLPMVVQGTGGVGLGYGANDATFANKYLAKAIDGNTSTPMQYGFGKVDVTPTTLTYSYVTASGQVLDTFTIGPPLPDTTPPTAGLTVPLDNGLTDQNPAINQVTVSTAQASFQILLSDTGDGVDDATVLATAVSMTKDLAPLVAGIDYTFAYNAGSNTITLAPLPPVGANFADGSYAITLNSSIEDLAGNPLTPTAIVAVVNTAIPTVVAFQDGSGGYAGTLDTYIHEDATGTNQGANAKINSDGDDDLDTAETNAQVVTGLIRFNNLFASGGGSSRIGGPIPDGATITGATLFVRTGTASGDVSNSSFDLHRMIATWDEGSTWGSLSNGIAYDNVEAASLATASVLSPGANAAGGLVSFDVTADVQLWSSNNSLSLRGWAIRARSYSGAPPVSGQTDGWWIDSSETASMGNRPILTISYVLPPANVSAGGPHAIDEGDSLILSGSATGTGSLTYSWDINGDNVFGDAVGASPTLTWAQLVGLGITNGLTTRDVTVRVADGYGHQADSPAALLTVNNVLPTADAGGPYAISEGSNLTLAGLGSDPVDPLTYSWDINGDSVFGDATGAAPTVTWAQLVALGINDGPGLFNVRVRVNDGDGGVTDSAPVTLTLNNVAPKAAISGPLDLLPGQLGTFTLIATDPSPVDQAANFTFHIDWNGDGIVDQIVIGPSGSTVDRSFATPGPVRFKVSATDRDAATGSAAAFEVAVRGAMLLPSATTSGLFDLVWGGTSGADHLEIEQLDATTVRLRSLLANGVSDNTVLDFSGVTGRVIARGAGGNDTINASQLATKATLDGGAGNNTLHGGQGGDLLIGGSNGGEGQQGNNIIIAGNGNNTIYGNDAIGAEGSTGGNNLIVGGAGNDTIYGAYGGVKKKDGTPSNGAEGGQNLIVGGGGSDTIYASQQADGAEGGNGSILVGGTTTLDQAALLGVLSEWTSARTYAQRIANIQGTGTGTRNNGNHFLQAATVHNDGSADQLFSDTNGELNWLLYSFGQDIAHRNKSGETSTDTP